MSRSTRYHRTDPLSLLSTVERLVEEAVKSSPQEWASEANAAPIPLRVWEAEDTLYIEASLPAIAPDDIDVQVHDQRLTISAERQEESAEDRRFLLNDGWPTRFHRALKLPYAIDTDQIEATTAYGILSLRLPKAPSAKAHKITIASTNAG